MKGSINANKPVTVIGPLLLTREFIHHDIDGRKDITSIHNGQYQETLEGGFEKCDHSKADRRGFEIFLLRNMISPSNPWKTTAT